MEPYWAAVAQRGGRTAWEGGAGAGEGRGGGDGGHGDGGGGGDDGRSLALARVRSELGRVLVDPRVLSLDLEVSG